MRVYTLQIHQVGSGKDADKVCLFEEFSSLKEEFKRQYDALQRGCNGGPCSSIVTEPYIEDDGITASGGFEFTDDTTGRTTIGKVYDYDVM